jgi:Histidine kinase-like ATPase domain
MDGGGAVPGACLTHPDVAARQDAGAAAPRRLWCRADIGGLGPRTPAFARAWIAASLRQWDLESCAGLCELVISELVTNAVRVSLEWAAGVLRETQVAVTPSLNIYLGVDLGAGVLTIEVHDLVPGGMRPLPEPPDDCLPENGRGLAIVAALGTLTVRPAPAGWEWGKIILFTHRMAASA